MANISAIKVGSTSYGITPASHASTATTYGAATASNYGHVKLSDNYTSSAGAASSGIGASSLAVYNAYNTLNSNKAQVVQKNGNGQNATVPMCPATSGVLCVGAFESAYYIGYTINSNSIIKISSNAGGGITITFDIIGNYITMLITNYSGVPRNYAGSVFY